MTLDPRLKAEWEQVKKAPRAFLAALIAVGGLIWIAMQWAYGTRLEIAYDRIKDYEARLNGWSPQEAQKQLSDLQEKLARLESIYRKPLTLEQTRILESGLAKLPPRKISISYNGPESYDLAKSLDDTFAAANWKDRHPIGQAINGAAGIEMYIVDDNDLPLADLLKEVVGPLLSLRPQRTNKDDGIVLYIGFRASGEN